VRVWTTHLRAKEAPVLVREGFSWGALLFGWLWLLFHRAWIPAALLFALNVILAVLTDSEVRLVLMTGIAVLQGLFGNDLRRWSLDRRGYTMAHVIAARNGDTALLRLLDVRPDLAGVLAR
jgi:ABC-type glucose/galactose transport system permease subunit